MDVVDRLLAENDPLPKQFRSISVDDTSFGARLVLGIARFFDALVVDSARFSLMIARLGWYPGGNLPIDIIASAATLLSEGNEEGERMLVAHFDAEIGMLERGLISAHPDRAEAIKQTIDAHKSGAYWLSVPSFLILAEAVANDMGVLDLHGKGSRDKAVLKQLESREDYSVAVAFLAPLLVPTPIDWSSGQREVYGNPVLNRRQVLHGESKSYGTQVGSCRALSHLLYVSEVLRWGPSGEVG